MLAFIKIILLSLFIVSFHDLHAGAVSGGGGNTGLSAAPITTYHIKRVVVDHAAVITMAWLNAKKSFFDRGSTQQQSQSAFYKLFKNDNAIFDFLNQIKIEVRATGPCYDGNGVAHDGSIFASETQAICISSFNLASKLNKSNYAPETIALIIHEISHFFEMTEEEADEIQMIAIQDLSQYNFDQVLRELNSLDLLLNQQYKVLEKWIVHPETILFELLTLSSQDWTDIGGILRGKKSKFKSVLTFLSPQINNLFDTQLVKLDNIKIYICIVSEDRDTNQRSQCLKRQQMIFKHDKEINYKTYFKRISGGIITNSLFLEKIILQRIDSHTDISKELKTLFDFLKLIPDDLRKVINSKFKVYSNEDLNQSNELSIAIEDFNKILKKERPWKAFFLTEDLV